MTQQEWRTTLVWPLPGDVDQERLDALVRALPGFGVVTADGETRRLRAEMTVEAGTVRQATDTALRAGRAAYAQAFGTAGEPVSLRVLTAADAEEEAARPAGLDLIGLREIAEILGVSPQRAKQLADEHPDFPDPVARPLMGPIFTRASVEAFNGRWERRPGRPRKS